jgi:hypothetical protein
MSSIQRKHTRFSLDIPATIVSKFGERQETILQQISVGGCFTGWEENLYSGDEFRLEIELPNKNNLPLKCRAVYRFENAGLGVKFVDITQFEQELISKIISHRLVLEGLPIGIDPFQEPNAFSTASGSDRPANAREQREMMLEEVMSSEESR